jgi:hypothetical protein
MAPQDKQRKDVEFITVDEQGKEHLNLFIFMESLLTLSMGKALDMGRLAIQHKEAFEQFQRTIKDDSYDRIEFAKRILKKYGYEDNTRI